MTISDMKLTKAERKAGNDLCCAGSDNEYPWGLSINLDTVALEKLGITELPDAGADCRIKAIGRITSVSQSASEKDTSRNLSIQITGMELICDDNDDFNEGFNKK